MDGILYEKSSDLKWQSNNLISKFAMKHGGNIHLKYGDYGAMKSHFHFFSTFFLDHLRTTQNGDWPKLRWYGGMKYDVYFQYY
jgi:hypothetical protein